MSDKVDCPLGCGTKLKPSSLKGHLDNPNLHGEDVIEGAQSFVVNGPQLGGEVARLEWLERHDPEYDWAGVRHTYLKKSGELDEKEQRQEKRKELGQSRLRGEW